MGVLTKIDEFQTNSVVTGEVPDIVRHQHSPTGHQHSPTGGQAVASELASLIKRVTASSVREVDHLIADLQMLREKLEGDAARVQRELAEYAAFGESTLQSMSVISECLQNRFPKKAT
jgi:hypothetical protein